MTSPLFRERVSAMRASTIFGISSILTLSSSCIVGATRSGMAAIPLAVASVMQAYLAGRCA